MLAYISIAQVLGMSLWFSASAVLPELKTVWTIGPAGEAWLTASVQLGFVAGAFFSALFNLADRLDVRRFFVGSLLAGAFFNGLILYSTDEFTSVIVLRFFTGASLAGVYPPGMKLVAGWFAQNRGVAIGTLIGALTIGSASPHLVRSFGWSDWRMVIETSSFLAVIGAVVGILFVREGPYASRSSRLNFSLIGKLLRKKSVRLANFGYRGHMWELFAMWAWIPFFLQSSFQKSGDANGIYWSGSFWAFGVIGVGVVGCVMAGVLADKVGRTWVAGAALFVSGICCLSAGFFWGGSEVILIIFSMIWGMAVVADSAQFSAMVSEFVSPDEIGTALTLQTCLGFSLTIISIFLLPYVRDSVGWEYVFLFLAPGPALGIFSMIMLHRYPNAVIVQQKYHG